VKSLCGKAHGGEKLFTFGNKGYGSMTLADQQLESAIFGGGCFWCLEAVFQKLKGVSRVQSGYMGGHVERPSYEQVCSKQTGHAEVVRVEFDPGQISYDQLLEVFFVIHDPTTLNRQGNDVGPQYRSVIFALTPAQQASAHAAKHTVPGAVTEIVDVSAETVGVSPSADQVFWPAEPEHDNYFRRNPYQGYCLFVVAPKVVKVELNFKALIAQ
jgi:peptide-methionine (S)-S-oxide reductase